jgi:hypothetical protein
MLIRPARQTYSDYDLGISISTKALPLWVPWRCGKTLPFFLPKSIQSRPVFTGSVPLLLRPAYSTCTVSMVLVCSVRHYLLSIAIYPVGDSKGLSLLFFGFRRLWQFGGRLCVAGIPLAVGCVARDAVVA